MHLRVWDVPGRRELLDRELPRAAAGDLTPDGRYLALAIPDGLRDPAALHFWDVDSGAEAGILEWDTEETLHDLAFAPDG